MGTHWVDGGYSASVEMYVLVDGRRHDIAQIGPDSLILRNPGEVGTGHAEIVICVDDQEERHDVILHCADPANTELAYA